MASEPNRNTGGALDSIATIAALPNLQTEAKDRRIAQLSAHVVYLERTGRALKYATQLQTQIELHSMKQAYDRRSWQHVQDMNAAIVHLEQALRLLGVQRLPD